MGMFNHVNYSIECPKCGGLVDGFQSKNGELTLTEVAPYECHDFHSSCSKCGAWVECVVLVKEYDILVTAAPHDGKGKPKSSRWHYSVMDAAVKKLQNKREEARKAFTKNAKNFGKTLNKLFNKKPKKAPKKK